MRRGGAASLPSLASLGASEGGAKERKAWPWRMCNRWKGAPPAGGEWRPTKATPQAQPMGRSTTRPPADAPHTEVGPHRRAAKHLQNPQNRSGERERRIEPKIARQHIRPSEIDDVFNAQTMPIPDQPQNDSEVSIGNS